jgi:ribonuclease T2
LSRNQRSPRQILSSIVVLLILVVVLYLNWDDKPTSLILTPPPTETNMDLSAEVPATQAPEEDGSVPALPVSQDQDFDYYVLSLSWSPQYCATDGSDDSQQCSLGRKLGFVLHGLWPQYERGYPSNCSDESFPSYLKQDFPALYPSNALYTHEWEKHGTCSGLTPVDYLAASKQLRDSVVIPEAYRSPAEPFRVTVEGLQDDFLNANPNLSANGIAVLCSDSGRFLSELRVCFTIEGQPRSCSAEVLKDASKSCGQSDFLVRNVK